VTPISWFDSKKNLKQSQNNINLEYFALSLAGLKDNVNETIFNLYMRAFVLHVVNKSRWVLFFEKWISRKPC
jgi:hypothetical protein